MLEIVNQSTNSRLLPEGLIVANDVDFKRSDVLIHKMKRMCTANLIVTNHEAQNFPGCLTSTGHSNVSEKGSLLEREISQILFDRVLCDVPCSGDGTLRKAPNIWWRWKAGIANGLHGLQVQMAMQGISLLKVGGRMVYSTCSMNPVENEAVVAEVDSLGKTLPSAFSALSFVDFMENYGCSFGERVAKLHTELEIYQKGIRWKTTNVCGWVKLNLSC